MGEQEREVASPEDNLWALYREGLLSNEELQAELARLPEPESRATEDEQRPRQFVLIWPQFRSATARALFLASD
jgi:hypothetical protein